MYTLTSAYRYNELTFTTTYDNSIDAREAMRRLESAQHPRQLFTLIIRRNGQQITDLDLCFDARDERIATNA